MSKRPPGEQSSRKALTRLFVDHSPPPGSRRRKRQRIDRSTGHSVPAAIQNPEGLRKDNGTDVGNSKGYRSEEAAASLYVDIVKPPVKSKVKPSKVSCTTFVGLPYNRLKTIIIENIWSLERSSTDP